MKMARFAIVGLCFTLSAGCALLPKSNPKEEQRQDLRRMTSNTLERLYEAQPSARRVIANSAGYAVFSNFGMKLGFAGGGSGEGMAIYRGSGREVFMKMVEVQAGLGLGIKKFRLVWVFESRGKLDQFVNSGWEIGGQGTAAAELNQQGAALQGAVALAPGVWLYQLTDDGLALELAVRGTKYFKNNDLN